MFSFKHEGSKNTDKMSGLRTMADMRKDTDPKGKGKDGKGVESYSGGEKSGMAVYQPTDDDAASSSDPFAAARANGKELFL